MRLLVSVRSAAEVPAVLAGGGDIVDAKEPARGSLGPVAPDVLREIAAALPDGVPLSAALGDVRTEADATTAVRAVPRLGRGRAPLLLKLGFAGVVDGAGVGAIVAAATEAARARGDGAAVVAVAYADHEPAGTVAPAVVLDAASSAGAAGVLVDTWRKDGRDLLHWLAGPDLAVWVARGRRLGLLTAIAGSLRGSRLVVAAACGADIVGVRGAACEGGRDGVVVASRVREVRRRFPGCATVSRVS